MKHRKLSQQGFSLIELIGVVAIIAILGALVAPRVLTSIDDAKVASVIQDAQRLRVAVTRFYKDTNTLPVHLSFSTDNTKRQLISNAANIAGWKGPYIEEELQSPFPNVYQYNVFSDAAPFDVDGNGISDFSTTTRLTLNGVTQAQAIAISDAIDGDADKTGTAAWYAGGKVRTRDSTATSPDLFIMLTSQ